MNLETSSLNKFLIHLKNTEGPSQIFSDLNSFKCFTQISKIIYFSKGFKFNYDAFLFNNFDIFLSNLLEFLYEKRSELAFDDDGNQYVIAFGNAIYLANNLTVNSTKFSEKYITAGLNAYLQFINDDVFVQKNLNAKVDFIERKSNLIDQILMNIKNLSEKTCDQYKHVYLDSKTPDTMIRIAKLKESCILDAYMTLIYVCSDRHLESLIEIDSVLNLIFKLIQKCFIDFKQEKFFRQNFEINFNGNIFGCQIHSIKYAKGVCISMDSLLECCYRLSVNEKIKTLMYFKLEIKNYLQEFLFKGNKR
jgi:hypothetical protein